MIADQIILNTKKPYRIYDEVAMRKRYILLIIGLITVFFAAGLLLFPQLRGGGGKDFRIRTGKGTLKTTGSRGNRHGHK